MATEQFVAYGEQVSEGRSSIRVEEERVERGGWMEGN